MGIERTIDITSSQRKTVLALIQQYLPGVAVWAYGSRVKWTSRPRSDLDLVAFVPPEQKDRVGDLREAFEESDLPFKVDLFVWDEVPESFREQIEGEHINLVDSSEKENDWDEYTVGQIADIVGGGTPSTKDPDNFGGNIPWLTPKDLSGPHARYITCGERNLSQKGLENSSAKLLPSGSVLLSTRAPVGYVAIAKNPISTNQGFRSLVPHEGFSSEYLYYWLVQNTEKLKQHATGTTFDELSGSALGSIRIRLPSLIEQRAIADVLSTLDDKIELNCRMNETLEEMARALFKSWFVDFDPVRAKMENRDTGLPKHIADLFPDRLVDSELGQIPEGWVVRALGDVSSKPQYGYTASAKQNAERKFLRITDINKKPWIEWDSVPYCDITSKDYEKYKLHKNDVLITRMADPGHGCLIEEEIDAVFASYLIRFCLVHQRFARFFQYWLRSPPYWKLVGERCAGTTRVSLNAKVLGEFPLIVPSTPLLDLFEVWVSGFRGRVTQNVKESRILSTLRDALLPNLLSGKFKLPYDSKSECTKVRVKYGNSHTA